MPCNSSADANVSEEYTVSILKAEDGVYGAPKPDLHQNLACRRLGYDTA
jgi:hypothetical protein